MNKPWLPALLADPDYGTEEWRRRMLYEHAKAQVREQRRNRFIGELVFVASLIAIGAILYWAAASLGIDVILLAIAAGLGLLALGRVYDIKRRQNIIKRLLRRVDKLSWDLKR